jgi:hypothetical protein
MFRYGLEAGDATEISEGHINNCILVKHVKSENIDWLN